MPVDIRISGDTAGEAVRELATLAESLVSKAVPAAVETKDAPKTDKPSRTRNTAPKTEKSEEDKPVQADSDASDPDPAPEEGDGESVTVEQLRAKASEVAQAGKQPNVKALLTEFGVSSISAVPEEQRAALMKRLEKLANG